MPSSALPLASIAIAATHQRGRATALPAALGKARTSLGRAATHAPLVLFQWEGQRHALHAPSARIALLNRRAVSPARYVLQAVINLPIAQRRVIDLVPIALLVRVATEGLLLLALTAPVENILLRQRHTAPLRVLVISRMVLEQMPLSANWARRPREAAILVPLVQLELTPRPWALPFAKAAWRGHTAQAPLQLVFPAILESTPEARRADVRIAKSETLRRRWDRRSAPTAKREIGRHQILIPASRA